MGYDEIFDGVVLAYDVYSFDKCAKILPGVYPYFGVNLKLNLLLFSPKPDMLLEGKVVKLTHESIHVVVLGFASAIITEKDIRAEFVYKMITMVDMRVVMYVVPNIHKLICVGFKIECCDDVSDNQKLHSRQGHANMEWDMEEETSSAALVEQNLEHQRGDQIVDQETTINSSPDLPLCIHLLLFLFEISILMMITGHRMMSEIGVCVLYMLIQCFVLMISKDLKDSRVLTDVGDVPIQEIRDCGVDDKRLMSVIGESVKLVMEEAPLRPLVLGGDHSISFPVIRAVSEKLGGPIDVLHIDAHPDNYDAFEGNIYSHASSFARVMEGDYVRRLLQVGIRSITAEGRAQAKIRSILRTTTLPQPSSLLTHLRLMSNLPENTVYSGPTPQTQRVTLSQLRQKHKNSQPITMVTAYDYPSAVHLDMAAIDICLVGDSASMVVHGHDTTLPITLDEMLVHCRAVARGAKTPLLVGDLPFGTYECSSKQAVDTAVRILKEGRMDAIKLEGGSPSRIVAAKAIVEAGIAVIGHVGLTPQAISVLGGFRPQGRNVASAVKVDISILSRMMQLFLYLKTKFAPGVSHIEPGGLSFRDVLNILHNLQGDVVAGDVVELNPQRDTVDGMTAMVAAKLVREMAAKIAK
ncbi:hypothetical protein RYX36_029212 [Vicia faba]